MQFPIEENLQQEPPISTDIGEDFCNEIHENKNIPLTEATPLNIAPPSFDPSESQQDLLMLMEKTKTLQADIETKLVDSLPPSPLETRSQLVIEDCKIHTQEKDATRNLGEMGDKISPLLGIELEDGEIESSSSEWEEDFELDSDLILEDSTKDMSHGEVVGVYGTNNIPTRFLSTESHKVHSEDKCMGCGADLVGWKILFILAWNLHSLTVSWAVLLLHPCL
ncbi:hypothetical protein SUGI_0784770 [Cryptomeria japonica]|nr:hypothetical protein SUGI_0784770 [Cryptomeria japonica]